MGSSVEVFYDDYNYYKRLCRNRNIDPYDAGQDFYGHMELLMKPVTYPMVEAVVGEGNDDSNG